MSTTYAPHAFARTDRTRLGLWWWTTDRLLLGAVTALIALGVALSFGSSPASTTRSTSPCASASTAGWAS